jgi:hypothetical protein
MRSGYDVHPVEKEDAVTFVAIWFCVAVVVGGLLGYSAHRLKRAGKARRVISNANTGEIRHRRKFGSSRESSKKTKKLDA